MTVLDMLDTIAEATKTTPEEAKAILSEACAPLTDWRTKWIACDLKGAPFIVYEDGGQRDLTWFVRRIRNYTRLTVDDIESIADTLNT